MLNRKIQPLPRKKILSKKQEARKKGSTLTSNEKLETSKDHLQNWYLQKTGFSRPTFTNERVPLIQPGMSYLMSEVFHEILPQLVEPPFFDLKAHLWKKKNFKQIGEKADLIKITCSRNCMHLKQSTSLQFFLFYKKLKVASLFDPNIQKNIMPYC